jgi:hypothetical protein
MDEQTSVQTVETPVPVEEVPAVDAPVTETATEETKTDPKARRAIPISVPNEMYDIVAKAAEENKITVAALARNILAGHFDYKLPANTRNRASKYGSVAERKAAQAAKQKDRYAKASLLLKALEAGEIDLDAIKAKLNIA